MKYWQGIAIALLFLAIGLFTLNDYGVTWDEPWHYNTGEIYYNYLFKGEALNLEGLDNAELRFYGPFNDIVGSISHHIFTEKLELLDIVDAHHLLFALFVFLYHAYNKKVALYGTLILALFPRFLGHAHVNLKDFPLTVFFTLALITFWFGTKKNKIWLYLSAVFTGLAFASKANAILLFPILGLWTLYIYRKERKKLLSKEHLLFLPIAIATTITAWPWLWTNPLHKLVEVITFFANHSWEGQVLYFNTLYDAGVNLPWHYASVMLFLITPLILWFFFTCSLHRFKKKPDDATLLLLLTMFVLLVVESLPNIVIYDGIRHFLPIIPALCMLAGLGMYHASTFLTKPLGKHVLVWGSILFLLFINISMHPYQMVYYNSLTPSNSFEVDYWGLSFKEGTEWLNENAADGETLYVHFGEFIPEYYLREDLSLDSQDYDYIMILVKFGHDPFPDATPIYSIMRQDNRMLEIYRGDDVR
jgi:4-amino-4-deoxy-L-arabinose transferase-like glycosyltransferase